MRVLYFNCYFIIIIIIFIHIFFFNTKKLYAQNAAVVITKKNQIPTSTAADTLSNMINSLLKSAESALLNFKPNPVMSMFTESEAVEQEQKMELVEKAKNIKKILDKNELLYYFVDNTLLNQIAGFEKSQIQATESVIDKVNEHLVDIEQCINNYEPNSLQKIYKTYNALEPLIKDSIKIRASLPLAMMTAVKPVVATLDLWLVDECKTRISNLSNYNIYLVSVQRIRQKCPDCMPIGKNTKCTISDLKANCVNTNPKNRLNCKVGLDKYHVFITQKAQNIETIIAHGVFSINEVGNYDIEIKLNNKF